MSMDDDDILAAARAGFIDESAQMLRQFEEALLVMETDPSDSENLNAAFRAAHTIKGTAGLFGCEAVVAFTHEVETVLEAMRGGELPVDERGVALLLRGRDQMEKLLAEIDSPAPDPDTARDSVSLGAELRALRQAEVPAPVATDTPAVADSEPASAPSDDALPLWHISLRFHGDALRNGLDPMGFIRYLGTVVPLREVLTLDAQVPPLDQLDPEHCHLGFEIRAEGPTTRTAIEEVFEFAAEDCDLRILAPEATPADIAAHTAAVLERSTAADERAALARWYETAQALLAGRQVGTNCIAPDLTAGEVEVDPTPSLPVAAQSPVVPSARPAAPERREGEGERRAATGGRRTADASFIRVRADKLDHLIDLIGELVIASSGAQLVARAENSPRFGESAQRISDLVEAARDGALGLRMVPIGETFTRFQRVVRDVSKLLGKSVDLQITGGDTELDKSMVETIADPLMHLVRNSLDHGLESTDERLAAGKPAAGTLALHAYHESGSVIIEVSDDGRGLNRDRILAKAVARGLVAPDQTLTDNEVHQLICQPGFSTAEQVTDISGRGVGMDVVKRNIEALRGQIQIASELGRGTTMQIRLPLTLAIIDGFLTSVAGVSYVLPLEIVAECIEQPPEFDLTAGTAAACFDLRGEVVPFLDLRRCFGHDGPRPARQSLIVVRLGGHRLGLLVDRLLGEHQTVIKPLGGIFQNLPGLAGATILGSGEVALILDVPALERRQIARPAAIAASQRP